MEEIRFEREREKREREGDSNEMGVRECGCVHVCACVHACVCVCDCASVVEREVARHRHNSCAQVA